MRVETRIFAKGKPEERRQLLFIADNETDSQTLDWAFGKRVPTWLQGRRLSDGFGEDYVRLEVGERQKGERDAQKD